MHLVLMVACMFGVGAFNSFHFTLKPLAIGGES